MASKTEEELVQKKINNFDEVNLHEFAQILRLDERDPTTQQLFRIHDKVRIYNKIEAHVYVNRFIEENLYFVSVARTGKDRS